MENIKDLELNLIDNIDYIKYRLGNSSDLSIEEFRFANILKNVTLSILFLSSMAEKSKIERIPAELNKLSELLVS